MCVALAHLMDAVNKRMNLCWLITDNPEVSRKQMSWWIYGCFLYMRTTAWAETIAITICVGYSWDEGWFLVPVLAALYILVTVWFVSRWSGSIKPALSSSRIFNKHNAVQSLARTLLPRASFICTWGLTFRGRNFFTSCFHRKGHNSDLTESSGMFYSP